MTTTVYVGNLDPNATGKMFDFRVQIHFITTFSFSKFLRAVKDLHSDFDRYGPIADVWVARKPPGFAFIEFESERDAKDAVADMDGR